jgi:hypothetical protein
MDYAVGEFISAGGESTGAGGESMMRAMNPLVWAGNP